MVERQEIKDELRTYLPKRDRSIKTGHIMKNLDVVLTTFSYFSSEKADDRNFLRKFEWNYVSSIFINLLGVDTLGYHSLTPRHR